MIPREAPPPGRMRARNTRILRDSYVLATVHELVAGSREEAERQARGMARWEDLAAVCEDLIAGYECGGPDRSTIEYAERLLEEVRKHD